MAPAPLVSVPPEVKQVEVTCYLMHADFSRPFYYTVA